MGSEDSTISIYFLQGLAGVEATADLAGVVYEEIYHSHQEVEIEENQQNPNIWIQEAPCSPPCPDPNRMPWIEANRYRPGVEVEAKSATLALGLDFSPQFRSAQESMIQTYQTWINRNPVFFYPPGTR